MKKMLVCFFFTFCILQTLAQDSLLVRKRVVWSGYALGYSVGLTSLYQLWFKNYSSSSFHVFRDEKEWLQMDKAGHFFSAYTFTDYSCSSYLWSGYNANKSRNLASLNALLFMSTIEIMDGFSSGWGFSPVDIAANVAGVSLFYLQDKFFHEQRIKMKFNFFSEPYYVYRPELMGSNITSRLIKDYNSQNYWISANLSSFGVMPRVPWLNIAIGYSATGLAGGFSNPSFNADGMPIPALDRVRQFYLSPDIDWRRIPVKSKTLKFVFRLLSCYKLTFPALEYSKMKFKIKPLM